MKRLLLLVVLALSACAPFQQKAQEVAAPYALLLVRDGADLVVPNPGGLLIDNWELSLDVTTDYQTDAQGQAWCPDANPKDVSGQPMKRIALSSPKYGVFNRIHCVMPALAEASKRRIVTVSGQVIASQGFGYREATGAVPIPLTLP